MNHAGVLFRPIKSTDLEQLLAWRNDRAIWKWCRQSSLITPAQHQKWYEKQGIDKSMRMYLIYNTDRSPAMGDVKETSLGVCGLTSIDHVNAAAEFSLYIDPQQHRQGYGKTALKQLLNLGFDNLNLNHIWGESFDGNPAMGMFESLGMKKEGTRREFYYRDGEYIDCHLFSILKEQWCRRR